MGIQAWSATRARTFQECRRKYYYRYQLAPLARRPNPPAGAAEVDRVKDLTGLEAWAGEIVHEVIRQVLGRWRAGKVVAEAEAVAIAVRMLSRQFRDSGEYWTANTDEFPRRPVLLDLHFYGDGSLPKDRAALLKETVGDSIRAFLRSDLASRIRAVGPSRWLPIDRNASARLEGGVLVLVRPDFAFYDGESLRILDWKTGRPDAFWELVQVTCYALYAQEKWDCPLPLILPQIVHLYPELRISETEFTPESVREVSGFIRESQGEILSLLDGDALPPVERFPPCEDGARCRWCQFRGVCDSSRRC
jgi:hypothetical protein